MGISAAAGDAESGCISTLRYGTGTWAFEFLTRNLLEFRRVTMGSADNYRQQADEAAARVDWCEKKLSFERKRHKALNDLAANEDWLDGKVNPMPKARGSESEGSASAT
jgi:hypothetical protein